MRIYMVLGLLLFSFLAIAGVSTLATLPNQGQDATLTNKQKVDKSDFESRFPVADYASSAPKSAVNTLENVAKRRAKNNKFGNALNPINPQSRIIAYHIDWAPGLPAIPASRSQFIIVGEVTDAQAFLTDDKTSVYSEFTVKIEDILKNIPNAPLSPGGFLTAERSGGRVKLPSGDLALQYIVGQKMPRAGQRYVLFLTRDTEEEDFSILTAYELVAGRVHILDDIHSMKVYERSDEASLIRDVRNAVAPK